ncbi:Glycosyltransferase family 92 protein [Caenorhabditis elegans]|uniref:Glycosyltransferase family 92 protein n=1 Tax=Caenorhabditis elegans TaxID=6239 RepID=O44670_CAEEL|nr:Glycosyltransferase family 92 protein [Caenorhabditis elegans]CCD64462.2 Glycosyltransferase family 92 protein [Caenorhabditis elegans]|eukprot:NP_503241.2 Uncharacterized protein CELE_C14C6.6 [Caenorhabditis elegans]
MREEMPYVQSKNRNFLAVIIFVVLFVLVCLPMTQVAMIEPAMLPKEELDNSTTTNSSHELNTEPTEILTITTPIINATLSNLSSTEIEDPEEIMFSYNSSDCPYEDWNQIRTSTITNLKKHHQLMQEMSINNAYLYHALPSVLAAFLHTDQIIVTLTSENQYNTTVFCRYYDCRRNEIMDGFESVVFPQSTVFCARRPGAKYISISKTHDEVPEFSVPIIPRIEKPPHYFTVCMATLYGQEPKFLQIVDFIEYHKLQGATFFHVYVRNITEYDRILLEDYARTGDIEIIKMHDHFWRSDYMWHNGQVNDCHHRNKYFSKWTAIIDLDERIEIRSENFKTVTSYLDSIHNSSISNLHFRVKWVLKHNNTPATYKNEKQLTREMLFNKYQNTSRLGLLWDQPKCIIRPEKVAAMTIHIPAAMYRGERFTVVPEVIGFIRHYRNVEEKIFRGALARMMVHAPFKISPIDKWINSKLTKSIIRRARHVYDTAQVSCEQKQKMISFEGIPKPCPKKKELNVKKYNELNV